MHNKLLNKIPKFTFRQKSVMILTLLTLLSAKLTITLARKFTNDALEFNYLVATLFEANLVEGNFIIMQLTLVAVVIICVLKGVNNYGK